MRRLNTKVVVSIGIVVIIGIITSVGFMEDSQNEEQNEKVLEESIEIVEEASSEETPAGKEFKIELKESLSIKGE